MPTKSPAKPTRKPRARAKAKTPLLAKRAPNPDDYTDPSDVGAKLRWLIDQYRISAQDIENEGIPKSTVYAYSNSKGNRVNPSHSALVRLAEIIGFPPHLWYLPIEEFDATLRAMYPQYAGHSGDTERDGYSNGYTGDPQLFSLAA